MAHIMPLSHPELVLLAYKLPLQPTRLRNQVWRKLLALGAVYVQDGVVALPWREDLTENLNYVAVSIREMEGSAIVFRAAGLSREDHERVVERFQKAGDARMSEILERLGDLEGKLPEFCSVDRLLKAEDALKRERVAYLKARRLNYFGAPLESEVEQKIAGLREALDRTARDVK